MTDLLLTLLYVPADRPDRVAKAFATDADVVLLDLEDAVAPTHKDVARDRLAEVLAGPEAATRLAAGRVQVRINGAGTPWHVADLAAVRGLPVDVGVRLPKVELPGEVVVAAEELPGRALHVLVESALGVEHAFALAGAHERVASLGLGEADLRADLRVTDATGLAWARGRVVVAARAAGLPAPAMSVHPDVRDLAALRESTVAGRAMGFLGRAAIHPAQLPVIREAFRPTPAEVARAEEVLGRIAEAHAAGIGALALPDGTFLDVAMVEQARTVVELARRT